MATTTTTTFFFLLLLLMVAAVSSAAPPSLSSSGSSGGSSSSSNLTNFIRGRCSVTLYPSICYRSLVAYADTIQQDPVRLAWAATNLTLTHVRAVLVHVAAIRPAGIGSRSQAAALGDCVEALGDAVDLARQSAVEVGRLEAAAEGDRGDVAWRVSNAQTWLSAALTNEDTCDDGFEGTVGDGALKADVCGRVGRVKQYTSNALALVNHLVAS